MSEDPTVSPSCILSPPRAETLVDCQNFLTTKPAMHSGIFCILAARTMAISKQPRLARLADQTTIDESRTLAANLGCLARSSSPDRTRSNDAGFSTQHSRLQLVVASSGRSTQDVRLRSATSERTVAGLSRGQHQCSRDLGLLQTLLRI